MQVRYDEGIANHVGPEPCVGIREDAGEASAGVRAGQPTSREITEVPDADVLGMDGRQHGRVRSRKRPYDPAWSWKLACAEAPCPGTGRSHGWPGQDTAPVRIGKARSRTR